MGGCWGGRSAAAGRIPARPAGLVFVAVAAAACLALLGGCGTASVGDTAPGTTGTSVAPGQGGAAAPGSSAGTSGSEGPQGASVIGVPEAPAPGWEQPSERVLAAFRVGADGLDGPLYVPGLVPAGSEPTAMPADAPLGENAPAAVAVALRADEIEIYMWEGVAGDLGDVDAEPCGSVDGRPAVVSALGEGFLVQWSDAGGWYAVFGRDLSRDEVVSFATAMRKEP